MASEGLPLPPAGENAPKRIGKYRILRQIAQGGMAEIYLASASGIEGFEKLCVLKRILPLLATNREFVQMFLDEARIAASLLHSNIAQVFDIGEDKGSYYFVMEFLRGQDVRHLLQSALNKKDFIPYEHVISIITGVSAGLHYAHEMRGKDGKPLHLVHRDISPQNVFVTHDGSVKLCDFGIAKSTAQLTETRVGTLKGKIRYMSPEQCRSEPLDRRSDVFALSIVLWELITLRRLFSGKSDFEIFKAIVELPMPKPSERRHDVPPGLEAIVMKGLSRDREERFQTAQELQLALEDWARAERVPASSVRLASFMNDLFGPPDPAIETILEKVTEGDPLAQRIRSLNSSSDLGSQLVQADATAHEINKSHLGDEAETTSQPSMQASQALEGTDAALAAEVGSSVQLSKPAPKLLVFAATLACVAAIALLVVRSGKPPAGPDTMPTVSAHGQAPVAAPAPPAPLPPPAGDPLPVAPPMEPARPASPTPDPTVQRAGSPSRPTPRAPGSTRKPAPKKAPTKKSGALDEFLPP